MSHSTSIYYIDVIEDEQPKKVPHTKGTKYTDFMDRTKAQSFLDTLVENNPGNKFRLCKETTTHTNGPWISGKTYSLLHEG